MKIKKAFSRKSSKRPRGQSSEELDINSLLDVLVILLVFLLNSYNPSDLFVDIPGRLNIPKSETEVLGNATLTMKVISLEEIWIDEIPVKDPWGSTDSLKNTLSLNHKTWTERLTRTWGETLMKEKGVPLNLVIDEEVDYDVVKKIMRVASEVGYNQFKLIVQYAK